MNILSQNEKTLLNYNNVSSVFICKNSCDYSNITWEIRAICPYKTSDISCTLAAFEKEQDCLLVFEKIINLIDEAKVNTIKINDIIQSITSEK